ncbi:selenide, water dikinase SelD [Paenibacillus sp.]|uniref:selenide, water dikinase SelD n=1 Tax=Paenibacillus sp. TaxID=58172 RepID=UPI002D5BBA53|nr:selenide, water dikinase SelD [Paenibacillus sp.]HZG57743.1 selenide, water dikinase SelD [Paenibacillus sp.]
MQQEQTIKLTSLSTKGGCGCKIGPGELSGILASLPKSERDPNLLVGTETNDDAGVYKLTDDLALVQTVDFFTPIVDDPYAFGQVAAANALSDVYAMGGTPKTVLNLVAFPIAKLDPSVLADILRGAGDKVREAGATLVGGHSIDDNEPKFGLAVTGVIHPDRVLANAGAKPGDRLLLTKPIGVGILTTAIKRDKLSPEEIERVTAVMATLNRRAAEVMADYPVHGCTDVTGFGLLGHALEMAKGSGVGIVIDAAKVPVLPRAKELAAEGVIPGGTKNNYRHVEPSIDFAPSLDELDRFILCDAVTSGGLLIAVDGERAEALHAALLDAGVEAALIGAATREHPGRIVVRGGEEA